jgi:hypothetical protein
MTNLFHVMHPFVCPMSHIGLYIFENRVLMKICELNRGGTSQFRSSPNIITVIKPRRVRGAGHVARMERSKF